jgi:hypothetical protein
MNEIIKNLTTNCKICGVLKSYKTKQAFLKYKDSSCKSCANSIKNGGCGNVRATNGNKTCIECKITKQLSEFHFYKNKNYYHSLCFDCKKEKFRNYQKTIGRFNRHGITKAIYDSMYLEQTGKCFTCEQPFDVLYIDHNHKTNKIRKLLCRDCNSALGLLKENINTINNLKNYIKNYG